MKLKAPPALLILIAALFFFGNLTAGKALVQYTLHPAQGRTKSVVDNNGLILDGPSAFENLREAAFMGNKQGDCPCLANLRKAGGKKRAYSSRIPAGPLAGTGRQHPDGNKRGMPRQLSLPHELSSRLLISWKPL